MHQQPRQPDSTVAGTPAPAITFGGGRYVVRRLLGEGGQKIVYLAHDAQLDRDVAIALLKIEGLDALGIARVQREAQAMARLDHPNVVTLYDIGEDGGRPFFVCQYIAGGDLRGALREAGSPLSLGRTLSIAEDLCRALAFAHEHGIVHRDVKPANIWLTSDGAAKLGDFGLAVALGQSRMTQAGTIMGTAAYMPPEQALGGEVNAQSDLYSLVCVLYEMVTGRPPFLGDDALAVISQHVNTAPVAPSWHNAEAPRPLDALIVRLLAKAPEERPASAAVVLDELRGIAAAGVPAAAEIAPAEPHRDLAGIDWGRFVGRREEMEQLKDALDGALSGKGALVMLVGEPGIGKTRLAEEFGVYAGLRGAQVLTGRAYEGEASLPYRPFVEALRQYTRSRPDDELRTQLGPGAPEIATLVSEIRARFLDIEEAPKLDGEAERLRLFESVTEFLHNAATAHPVVLFLDDLHWADKASLLLLQHLAQRTARDRLLILGAYRDMELDRTHPLSETLGALRRLPNYRRVLLRGLPEETITDLLTAMDPSEEGAARRAALGRALHQETEGNPFFIREVMAHLIETGKIVHENGRWEGQVTSISELGIPEGVREVVGRRLSQLTEGCNRMLTLASTMAGGFSWDALKAINADVPEAQLLDLLEEALTAQLIAERRSEGGRYDFTHALIRQTLYEELSTPRRVLLHRQIGEALERLYGATVEPHLAELAHHFYQAAPGGDVEKAIDYARRAGDQAMTRVAWEASAAHYERALQAMDPMPAPDEQVRVDVLLALGRALEMGGAGRERWRAVFQRAAELARGADDYERYARAALGFADLLPTSGVVDADVVRMLEEALYLLGPAEGALRARVLARLGNELSFSEQHERKKPLLADALQVARRVDDPETLAYVLANHTWEDMDAAQALGLAREQVEAARRARDKHAELRAHNELASRILALGDRAGFDGAVEEEERLQRELRIVDYETGWHRVLVARMDGRFDETERLAGQTFAEQQHDDPENAAQTLGVAILGLRAHQGRLLEMEPAIKANAERYPAIPTYRAVLAWAHSSEGGRWGNARAVFGELAERGFGHLPSDALLPVTLSLLADVCWSLGDAARAPELYEMLSPCEGECVVVGFGVDTVGAVSRSLALLAATMRRWEDAERHFEDAVRMNTQLGDKPWLAHTRAQYGAALLARGAPGDRERALELLQLALDAAQEMGMKKVIEDCMVLKVNHA